MIDFAPFQSCLNTVSLWTAQPLLLRLFFYSENYPEQVCQDPRTFDNYDFHM